MKEFTLKRIISNAVAVITIIGFKLVHRSQAREYRCKKTSGNGNLEIK